MKAILTRCGGEVTCSESVADAISVFKDCKPDLVVSDIGMPNEDGYMLIQKLRSQRSKRARTVPVLALTAYATSEDRTRALAAGFQRHLAKPLDPESLVRSLAEAIGRKI